RATITNSRPVTGPDRNVAGNEMRKASRGETAPPAETAATPPIITTAASAAASQPNPRLTIRHHLQDLTYAKVSLRPGGLTRSGGLRQPHARQRPLRQCRVLRLARPLLQLAGSARHLAADPPHQARARERAKRPVTICFSKFQPLEPIAA